MAQIDAAPGKSRLQFWALEDGIISRVTNVLLNSPSECQMRKVSEPSLYDAMTCSHRQIRMQSGGNWLLPPPAAAFLSFG